MVKYYGIELSPNKTETVEGFLICRNVPIARTGVQQYMASELGLDGDNIIDVERPEEEVFSEAAIASFEGKPITNEHPSEMVSPDNFTGVACGHVQNVRRVGNQVVADLYISDAKLIEDVQNKVKKEVSCGYACDYVEENGKWKQTNIRGNHVAVVPLGRAGHDVAIKDSAIKAEERSNKVKKGFFKALLSAFGTAAKDAEPEEIEKMVEAAAATIEAAQEGEPAKAQEPNPAADEGENAEGKKDEGEKTTDEGGLEELVKKIMERLDALEAKLSATDEEKTPEEMIEEAITAEEKTDADPEAAVTVKAEEMAGDECKEMDTAAFLRAVKPIIAGIKDPEEKKRAADAAIKQVRGGKDNYEAIFKAAKDSAKNASMQSGKTSQEKRCEEQQSYYDAMNPHKK